MPPGWNGPGYYEVYANVVYVDGITRPGCSTIYLSCETEYHAVFEIDAATMVSKIEKLFP
jgi:hypothetical protein